ncbi:MAG: hypothetical protein ACRD6X_05015 [Pyrinomonadaceae bacterium]
MKKTLTLTLAGMFGIVIYDFISAFISSSTGISYGFFSVGSFLLYILFGFLVGRTSRWYFGTIAGAMLGLAESTVGWAISWNLGPGKLDVEMNAIFIALTIVFVIILATIFGLIGGLCSLLIKRNA